MAAALHKLAPARPDAVDAAAIGEDPGVEDGVAASCPPASDGRHPAKPGRRRGLPRCRRARRRVPRRRLSSASSNSRRPVEPLTLPSTLRSRCARRCEYSSWRSSSATPISTLESEPMPKRPPASRKRPAGNVPSPRFASVTGQSPATAPLLASSARLGLGHVRGMDQAPAPIDLGTGQAAIRPAAPPTRRRSPRPPWSARRHGCGSGRRRRVR